MMGAFGDKSAEIAQTVFEGGVPQSYRTLGGWLGSQAAPGEHQHLPPHFPPHFPRLSISCTHPVSSFVG